MSVITLQLGQCGNQVGGQLFQTFIEDVLTKPSQTQVPPDKNQTYKEEVLSRFFYKDHIKEGVPEARAVMVDMEPKVIAQTCSDAKKTGQWMYPAKQQLCQQKGSGNNWAHGYCIHGHGQEVKVMEMVQREAEKCDNLSGFLSLMSVAGGTGSGVGAYITECIKDEFPHSFLLNQVVLPYSMGEVIVQNYNAVLTLSHLYRTADALIVMENDHIQKICSQLLNLKKVSFRDINKVITHKLASVLQPVLVDKYPGYSCQNTLGELMEHLVPHNDYKLLTVKNIPQMSEAAMTFSSYQWHGLLKHLRQMLIADAAMEEGINWQVKLGDETPRGTSRHNRSLANFLVLRGKDAASADTSMFADPSLYAPWVPPGACLLTGAQPRLFGNYEKSASLVSNSRTPVRTLDHIVDKAWSMFSSRAYVHQYVRHGLAEEDFLDSFVTLEQVIASYNNL
ncbi:LOW QUALITY PROTEIN: tubulin delta chain-like [Pecten maximus]|uniref:LOW QUALITY PROTEIN: tubulin delta chain-like n=1 Tax=Pecten maximus TaxID=6579 RepID=UPI001458CF16|nr:LOW QUALITY PROTEIN: tubulin delta chain-like [Pecten maximus]